MTETPQDAFPHTLVERLPGGRARVTLSDEDYDLACKGRDQRNRYRGGENPNADRMGRGGGAAHSMGAFGEVGAARFYGLPTPRFEIGPDDGYDLEMRGCRVNVKGTLMPNRYLLLEEGRTMNCHAYMLVKVDEENGVVEIIGTAPARGPSGLENAPMKDFGRGRPCHAIHERDLTPPRWPAGRFDGQRLGMKPPEPEKPQEAPETPEEKGPVKDFEPDCPSDGPGMLEHFDRVFDGEDYRSMFA